VKKEEDMLFLHLPEPHKYTKMSAICSDKCSETLPHNWFNAFIPPALRNSSCPSTTINNGMRRDKKNKITSNSY